MDLPPADFEQHLARFGLARFRPGQRDVISAVLERHDCLCIMPTGGGKSLCYQLPSVAREGLTLVVSPLIALMKDQVDALHALGIAATFINSSLTAREQFERMDAMAAGQYDLVYIAPERLRSTLFVEKLRAAKLQLLAVDEAHCISEWGHDFRPDYARIGLLRQRLGNPQTIALTATATPKVRSDVAQQLRLREPKVFITGFARTNLHFEVHPALSDLDKGQTLLDFLAETPGAGIIYASTRKRCEELVETLRSKLKGRKAGLYHAGLEQDERRRVQDEFMSGRLPIIVATNAFGMGIDKADLRFVVHYNIPGSLEAYYQEAGRAGRDGQPSRCLLIYTPRDRNIQEFFIDGSYPEPEIVKLVYDYLRGIDTDPIELTLDEIKDRLGLNIRGEGISACEKLLEGVKALERLDSRQNMAGVKIDSDLPTLVDLLPREAKVQRRVLRAIEQLVGELRGERVYVNPRQIAQEAETDLAGVGRAMRELSKLKAFDYVPPFRGRAVHMLERKMPFEKLGIDFAEQQRRKGLEYAKLDRMIAYATSRRCRQLEILEYFGDPSTKPCGLCDHCGGGRPLVPSAGGTAGEADDSQPAVNQDAVVEAARIVLSGVARICQRGQFGRKLLALMLVGSASAKVTKLGLERLSTYGLLKHLTEEQVTELIDALLRQRLLQQVEVERFKPVVQLTPRGEQVMRGQTPLTEPLALGSALLQRLGAAPARPAKTPLPAPTPKSEPPDFDPFAEANQAADEPVETRSNARQAASVDPAAGGVRPPHYWTWRVLASGISASECCQIRNLDADTVFDHVLRAAREGEPVQVQWLLSPAQVAALAAALGEAPHGNIRSLLANLPAGIKYRDVQLYLLSRGLNAG
ncbi:MAG: RecQ family ATP-dependent DNA helicase [Pirellulaceae bacterium]